MAVNDPKWEEGEIDQFQSSGTTPTPRWYEGEVLGIHEYVVVGVAPTGALYGPLVGPLGGPI